MSGIWKVAGLVVLFVVAGAIGAGAYSAVDGKVDEEPKATYEPMLTDEEITQLAFTHLRVNDLFRACLGMSLEPRWSSQYESMVAHYKDNGSWIATVGSCTFVVDDATGEVTGP